MPTIPRTIGRENPYRPSSHKSERRTRPWYRRKPYSGLFTLALTPALLFLIYWEETGEPAWFTVVFLFACLIAVIHSRSDHMRWLKKMFTGTHSDNRRGFLTIIADPSATNAELGAADNTPSNREP